MTNSFARIFSDYREEWATDDFQGRFVEPPYYAEFSGAKPMFLVGGRGTGKTIALRSLHFTNRAEGVTTRPCTGIYIKAFKNRVQAFCARHLPQEIQIPAFQHYMNLMCCLELCEFSLKFWGEDARSQSPQKAIGLVREHFALSNANIGGFDDLYRELRSLLAKLSHFINNPGMVDQPLMSTPELPVVDFAKDLHSAMGLEGSLYICIDEWENLSKSQQEALNQWIKNSGAPITYKLGVREGGKKTTSTGGASDPLNAPADYAEKHIAGASMIDFCRRVVEVRLAKANADRNNIPASLDRFLPGLTRTEEASKLGAKRAIKRFVAAHCGDDPQVLGELSGMDVADAYLTVYQAQRTETDLRDILAQAKQQSNSWKNTVNNYGHLSLFAITRRLGSVSLHKYYCGQKTFLHLSGGNIRYLLELLDESVNRYLQKRTDETEGEVGDNVGVDPFYIPPEIQTEAAMAVAKGHLDQIEGLSDDGLKIARLVRSLGTAFGAVVREPRKVAPECTSFTLRGEPNAIQGVRRILDEGCGILAFVRETVTKRLHPKEVLEDEYRIHALLSPHFRMPYRHKRRAAIDAALLQAAAEEGGGAEKLYSNIVGEDIDDTQMDMLRF